MTDHVAVLREKATVTDAGCWINPRRKPGFYSQLSHEGRKQRAHRVAWTVAYGPIPDGLFVCHRCNNKGCFNPKHLYLGTPSDNQRDAWRDGLHKSNGLFGHSKNQADKATCIRGHPLTGENVYLTSRGRRHCRACAAMHDRAYKARKRAAARRKHRDEG